MDSSLTKKTGVVFLDLTAAYDAVWHLGLQQKLSKTLPRWIVDTVALFLRDRRFRVQIADKCSSWRLQRNGLPLGSVLSPCLFIVYINDLPSTHSRKFNCRIKRPHFHVISCALSTPAFSTPAFSTRVTSCRLFHSRVFHPCHLVPRFPLLHFPPVSPRATLSTPAFSTPAFYAPP